jgi:hypothetical protein
VSTIAEIKTRLRAAGTPFRLVEGAAELNAVKDAPTTTPAAYVLTAKEASGENTRATGPILQLTERDITVAIAVRNMADPRGDAASTDLESIKSWVRGQLIGFVPSDMQQPITHVAGEISFSPSAVWFEDTYSAPTYTRESI